MDRPLSIIAFISQWVNIVIQGPRRLLTWLNVYSRRTSTEKRAAFVSLRECRWYCRREDGRQACHQLADSNISLCVTVAELDSAHVDRLGALLVLAVRFSFSFLSFPQAWYFRSHNHLDSYRSHFLYSKPGSWHYVLLLSFRNHFEVLLVMLNRKRGWYDRVISHN